MPLSEFDIDSLLQYLDGELSPEKEIAFVQKLTEDKELQEAFDMELLLRSQHKQKNDNAEENQEETVFEPADQFLKRSETILTGSSLKAQRDNKTPVLKLWGKSTASVAAAVIVIVTASILYFNYAKNQTELTGNNSKQPPKNNTGHSNDTTTKQSGTNDTGRLIVNDNYLTEVSDDYYKRYKQNIDDPVEVSLYYELYAGRKYAEVLKSAEADYGTKGGGGIAEQKRLDHYMLLYKALSLIETGKPAKGAELLKVILQNNKQNNILFYNSQFYLLMAYMKLNDKKNTEAILDAIKSNKNHPYRKTALEVNKVIDKK